MKFAIFGAAGAVGKELGKILAREHFPFRVVGRSERELRNSFDEFEPLVEYCIADLMNPEDAARAASGIETVFYTVGVPYTMFKLHPLMSEIAVAAAADAGVRRFVHLSTIYSYGRRQADKVTEDHPREPHAYKGRMRKKQEDIVLSSHGRSGMQVTILCPPDFYGGDSRLSFMYPVFQGALEGKTANLIGPIDLPHEFVYVPDLADTLFKLSKIDEAFGRRWNLAGTGLITMREFAEATYAQEGKKPMLRTVEKTMLWVLGRFNPFMRELFEMHYLIAEPLYLDDSRLKDLIPDLRKTSYEDGIKATLEAMKGRRNRELRKSGPGR